MSKIKLLDEKTINKIAAGEVVERPVAVVKELVENAVDALSTSITVEVKKGGISYIRITDNGTGMDEEDLRNAFIRHSTSKISKVEDLGNIITLGFRGEALASIAAVSRLEMISKERDSSTGSRVFIQGGDLREESSVGTKDGTTIIVRDLFYNVPVRRSFLKSETAEAMAINDFVYKLAVSNPGISFTYIRDGKSVLKTPGNGDLKSTVYSVLGADFIKSSFHIDTMYKDIGIRGYISDLKFFRGNRANQFIFINGRTVRSPEISKAVEDIYKERLPIGKFPNFILFMEIDPSKVDVNMHPTKMEVRFRNEPEVIRAVKKIVSDRLVKENLIPEIKLGRDEKKEDGSDFGISAEEFLKNREKREQIPVFELIEEKNADKGNSIHYIDENAVFRKGGEEAYDIFPDRKDGQKEFSIAEPSADISDLSGKADSAQQSESFDKSEERKEALDSGEVKEESAETGKDSEAKTIKETVPAEKSEVFKSTEESGEQNVQEKPKELNKYAKQKPQETSEIRIEAKAEAEAEDSGAEKTESKFEAESIADEMRYAGIIFNTYILCENRVKKEFFMIDQHAAHERILYEEFRDKYRRKEVYTQDIIGLEPIELSMNDMIKVERNADLIRGLGFSFDVFGQNSVILRGIPLIFGRPDGHQLFLDILDDMDMNPELSEDMSIYDKRLDKLMKKACTSAIKGGDSIERIEADELIKRLFRCENPYTCPHGRPITLRMSLKEIEKHFSRIQ